MSSPISKNWQRPGAMPLLLLALVALQLMDLHSSLTSVGGIEQNLLVNVTASWSGSWQALVFAKLLAFGGVASLYAVWRRFPRLRREAMFYAGVSVAVYAFVVAGNYGVIG